METNIMNLQKVISSRTLEDILTEWIDTYYSSSDITDRILTGVFITNDSTEIPVSLDVKAYLDLYEISSIISKYKSREISEIEELKTLRHDFPQARLDGITLYDAELNLSEFTGRKLSLSGASLIDSKIISCTISDCVAVGANFTNTDFTNSDLSNSNFSAADLTNTCFNRATVNNLFFIPSKPNETTNANFFGSNYNQIRTPPEVMSEIEYNLEDPAMPFAVTVNDKISLWESNHVAFSDINTKTYLYSSNYHEGTKPVSYILNTKIYKLMLNLSYNLSRANNISDDTKSDKKKQQLIVDFNATIKYLYPEKNMDLRKNELLIQDADLIACSFNPDYRTSYFQHKMQTCNFNDFNFDYSEITRTSFTASSMQRASFLNSKIINSDFDNCLLNEAKFINSVISMTGFNNTVLSSTDFKNTRIDTSDFTNSKCDNVLLTDKLILNCNFSNAQYTPSINSDFKEMKFLRSNIDVANISDDIKSIIQYNRRKSAWETQFSKQAKFLKRPSPESLFSFKAIYLFLYLIYAVSIKPIHILIIKIASLSGRAFWYLTDYGHSTQRIIVFFFYSTFLFGIIFYFLGDIAINLQPRDEKPLSIGLQLCRSFYFSIVTMTTLGFGDVTARADSYLGYPLISLQVLLGYITLGALITRLGILFTSPGLTTTPQKYMESLKNKAEINTEQPADSPDSVSIFTDNPEEEPADNND